MARSITVSVPHRLTREEVRARLEKGLGEVRTQYGKQVTVEDQWSGDTLNLKVMAMGQKITGRVEVEPEVVRVHVDLPWLMGMFADRARREIEQHGRKLLENQ